MTNHYHYIITGAGCAGMSLLMRMMRDPFFADKKILVIDRSPQTVNDRTWCFWEERPGIFEEIVYRRWDRLQFFSDSYSDTLEIGPYQYKMIRSQDLYAHVRRESAKHANIEWREETVREINNGAVKAIVMLENVMVYGDFVFNSIVFKQPGVPRNRYYLRQLFTGWMIRTQDPHFDPSVATLMDFRTAQEKETCFFHVLPVSANEALVRYTVFSEHSLQPEEHEAALQQYITATLGIGEFETIHTETGIVPMTNMDFPGTQGRIIQIGIAGGQAKGSTGNVFPFIQQHAYNIIAALKVGGRGLAKASAHDSKRFRFYDSVLLNVLSRKKMTGSVIFASIFSRNPAYRVLKFLSNETTLAEDWKIMRSVPAGVFLPAAFHELIT